MIDRNAFNAEVIEAFRTQSGVAPDQVGDMPLLLLTTTGARSGQPRLSPLAYIMDGDRYVVVASKGGSPTHPDWYHNIAANPDVTVEVGTEKFSARAEIAAEPERTRLFNAAVEVFPQLGEHERNAGRIIPIITLTRV
jgi:deazaflavin-dependent oxidoreductase (nitroreductase family)